MPLPVRHRRDRRPARLQRDGRVTAGSRPSGFPYEDLPHGIDTELLVETGGLLQGRFLMAPGPDTHSTLEQRLIAVAFANLVGAALASSQSAHRQS